MKKRLISLIIAAIVIVACLPPTAARADYDHFDDVPSGAWYADAVNWAVLSAVTNGTSATEFSPDMICTRAQVVTFLWRAHGCSWPGKSENPFNDVAEGSWYEIPVMWAVENGITNGTSDTTFSPDNQCTCGQILTFLWRAEGCPVPEMPSEITADWPDSYYKPAVEWAESKGMLEDTDVAPEEFDPMAYCARGLVVKYLYDASFRFVTTVDQLVNELGPCRNICLAPGEYNLTKWMDTASDTDLRANPYIFVDGGFDGREMIITGLEHVRLYSSAGEAEDVRIVVEPRYANVLSFKDCNDIRLQGMTMGHTPEQGFCTGGVVYMEDCGMMFLQNLDLYGCGTYGVTARDVEYIYASGVNIHDCSYGGMELYDVGYASFNDSSIVNCREFDTITIKNTTAEFSRCTFRDNYWGEFSDFLLLTNSGVTFYRCSFDRESYDALEKEEGLGTSVILDNCGIV